MHPPVYPYTYRLDKKPWSAHVCPNYPSSPAKISTADPPDAKNNTTQANLSYYERSLLRKVNQAQRLGGDSFKPLDSCYLCLSKTFDPVACSQGHIYCRECIVSNLITQKAGIDAQRREMDRWEENDYGEREQARQNARDRVVADFEKGMGLGVVGGRGIMGDGNKAGSSKAGGKFELDRESLEKATRDAEDKAKKQLEVEHAESRKAKLAAYWLPSMAPEAKLGPVKDIKLQTLCHMGQHPHPVS